MVYWTFQIKWMGITFTIPNMIPFYGTNSTSVVVMDNCSIHHVEEVKLLLEEAGILVPPYSPDHFKSFKKNTRTYLHVLH